MMLIPASLFAQSDSSASDSTLAIPPPSSPLGMSDETGLALFLVALLFLVFIIFLWRKRLDRAMTDELYGG